MSRSSSKGPGRSPRGFASKRLPDFGRGRVIRGLAKSRSVMLPFTSLPNTSQPGVCCRAKSSMRGRSPTSSTIRSRTAAGFSLCVAIGASISDETAADRRCGDPLVPSRHNSAFARVQCPIPMNHVGFRRFRFTQVNATVLYENPHASMTRRASRRRGIVAQRKSNAFGVVIAGTGRAAISVTSINGYLYAAPRCPARATSRYVHGGSA